MKMRILSLLAAVFFFLTIIPKAWAVKVSASASVEIVEPAGFTERSGFGTLHITRSTNILKRVLGAANSNEEYTEEIPPSEYLISGSKDNAIQIQVGSQGDASGVKVDDFIVNYSNNDVTENNVVQPAPGRNASLKLGATLTVAGGTKAGVYSPEFDIAVYYE